MNEILIFGFWTVLDLAPTPRADGYRLLCRCVCGTSRLIARKTLKAGRSKSCGCHGVYPGTNVDGHTVLQRDGREMVLQCVHGAIFRSRFSAGAIRRQTCPCERDFAKHSKHGESPHAKRTTEYNSWRLMRQRCNDPKNKNFKHYGGRGIKVCSRWDRYENFLADLGRKPAGHSLDRIDVNGNYEPANCRWADAITQRRNQRRQA